MIEYKTGYPSLSKTSLLNRYNLQSGSLLQHLEYNNNKREFIRQNLQSSHHFKKEEEYEQRWQSQFLKQLQLQLNPAQTAEQYYQDANEIQYKGDRLSRQINGSAVSKDYSKGNNKQFQKYKAYAVRMKIPSFQQVGKPKTREDRISHLANFKNRASSSYLKQLQQLIQPKLGNMLKESTKQNPKSKNYQSINEKKIFKRNIKTSQIERNLHIRKRSIKHGQKKQFIKNIDQLQKNIESSPTKDGLSINRLKKAKKSTQRSSATPYLDSRNNNKQRGNSQEESKEFQARFTKSPQKLPQYHQQKKTQYLEKGISFKRKGKKSPSYQTDLIEKISKHLKKPSNFQHMINSGMKDTQGIIRQTPQNILLRSIMTTKQSKIKKVQNIEETKNISKQEKRFKDVKVNKIISFNSEDKYIRRLLESKGWILNPDTRSKYYHLKWVFKPLAEDYNHIREGQYINHIKNSHQLTSKNCLNKNLKAFFPQAKNLNNFYPQCFDISKPNQKQQFFEQYIKQFMMLLLRKIYHYIESNQFQLTQELRKKYQSYLESDGNYKTEDKHMSFMRKKQFRNIDMENFKSYDSNFTLHINLLIAALKYWRFLRKQGEFQPQEGYHFLSYNQKQFENNLNYLEKFSQMANPTFKDESSQYFTKEFYSTPSCIAVERIVKEYVYFQNKLAQKWLVFGDRNIWIIKPCSASRGNGIYLQNNCRQILFNSKGIQSKIVQKYIERPLLFKNPRYPQICNRKFDIRQWVLLRSIDPLQIYMFSHFYVRICSEVYNINNINNLKTHLTNYSFNKQHFKSPAQSVLDYDTFKNLLKEEYNVDYQTQLKEKVKHIIIKSIKSAQQHLNDFDKRCFSLLGYDILLDQKFNPWLLEVNMSPACEERTQWLINYLKQMGHGILKIVLPEQYLQPSAAVKHQDIQKSLNQLNLSNKIQVREDLQQKRTKTEMSHEMPPEISEHESNLAYNLSQNIENGWRENKSQISDNSNADLVCYEDQITYHDFIKQHMQTEQEIFYGNEDEQKQQFNEHQSLKNRIEGIIQFQQIQKQQEKDNLIPLLYLQSQASLPPKNVHLKSEPCQENDKSEKQKMPKILQNKLKWQLICYQEYAFNKKKQIDCQLEVVGLKISNEAIKANDIFIDQLQETKFYVQQCVCKLQSKIKQFLRLKQQKLKKIKEQQQKDMIQKRLKQLQQSKRIQMEKKDDLESIQKRYFSLNNQAKDQDKIQQDQLEIDDKKSQIMVSLNKLSQRQVKKEISIVSEEDSIIQAERTHRIKIIQEQKGQQDKQLEADKSQRDQKIDKATLKLNFSQITKNTMIDKKGRSRSVVMDSQFDNSSIWHYSYLHTYRQGIVQKTEIDKNMSLMANKSPKPKRIKNFYQHKSRDKNSSITINAIADVSASQIEQVTFKKKPVQEQRQINQQKIQQQSSVESKDDDIRPEVKQKDRDQPIQDSNNG